MKQENKSEKIIKSLFPIHSMIYENIMKSQVVAESILEGGNWVKIKAELTKKRAEAEMNELNAKVLQELAIANRIENAVDVEIEEYYEKGGSGKVTGTLTEENTVVDLGGNHKKIEKRVYKFKGLRNE
jgi:glycogen synthase